MKPHTKDILKIHQLRSTTCREDVLDMFLRANSAKSQGDIEHELGAGFDRVTIYRTLKTFLDKGIIHKVLDGSGTRYALCEEACPDHHHQHDHVHFKCTSCGETNCLNQVKVAMPALPKGYEAAEINLLIEGTCPRCG